MAGSCSKTVSSGKGNGLFDNPRRRNRDLEDIIEKSDFGLKCSKAGCNVVLARGALLKHERQCEYRAVHCPVTSCGKKVLFTNLDNCIESHAHGTDLNKKLLHFLTTR